LINFQMSMQEEIDRSRCYQENGGAEAALHVAEPLVAEAVEAGVVRR
jgi:hypothetical protein